MLQQLLMRPHMVRRLIVLLLSVIVMGFCVAILDQLGFGTDPCSVMNLGMSRKIGWSFGNYQLMFNLLLILLVLLLREPKRIGLGTIANMVLVGYAADAATWVINQLHPLTGETLMVRVIVFIPTIAVFMIAVAFYIVVDLGVAPYDALPQIITARTKGNATLIRVLWDVSAAALGWAVGGTVGAVTIVTGFFLGPIISAIARKFQRLFE